MSTHEKQRPGVDLEARLSRAASEPMPMSQEEVEAMAAGGPKANVIAKRLVVHRQPRAISEQLIVAKEGETKTEPTRMPSRA